MEESTGSPGKINGHYCMKMSVLLTVFPFNPADLDLD